MALGLGWSVLGLLALLFAGLPLFFVGALLRRAGQAEAAARSEVTR